MILKSLKSYFQNMIGFMIPTSDIRDKPKVNKLEKLGMMTQGGEVKEEYKDDYYTLVFKN